MRYFLHILTFIIFTLYFIPSYLAQPTTDEQLAVQYYQSGEFDKAQMYYEKLYNSTPNDFYYQNYLQCLIKVEDFKTAEKLIKKHSRLRPTNLKYMIDMGYVYNKEGNNSKAKQQYDKTLKQLNPNQGEIIMLANAFLEIGETDYALKTYQAGEKLLQGYYPFNIEIASIYAKQGNYVAMIDEYLELLEISEGYIQTVQNALNNSMSFEKNSKQNQLLKTQLLKNIQQRPNKTIYAEMLIWLYIQQKDFDNAFVQVKALDRRKREDGFRVIALAQLCHSNNDYDIAVKCYEYVINKGNDEVYYTTAKMELLNVLNEKITTSDNYTAHDLTNLETAYFSTIDELGKSATTISLLKELAHLQAYYLNKSDTAISLLEQAINTPQIKSMLLADCKLELGDILLITGEIWDASLYYSQVEKAFKYEPIGDEAKLRNAKIHYYTGDFGYAKANLDVLKGSTSKLIANDAMDLSLLITDNTTADTTEIPLLMFARADLLALQNNDSLAILILDSINTLYQAHSLADEILFKKHSIAIKHKDYTQAAEYLQQIIDTYSYDILADDALFLLAQLNEMHLDKVEEAQTLYQKLLIDYPGSLYTVEARKRFRKLRGDEVN